MTDERFEDSHSLVLQKCATHPFHIDPSCPVCKSFEDESRRIEATRQELIKQPCEVHKYEVDSTCRECFLWAAQGGDLRAEKQIDFSVAERDNRDLCSFISEQVAFRRIRKNTHEFNQDWLTAMNVEEKSVNNLTAASDASFSQNGVF